MRIILIGTCLLFVLAYLKYGRWLSRVFELNAGNHAPSHTMYDGVDYVPTPAPVLFGHHFSSIAGAGPVLGPIIAGLAFGWLPVWLWVVIGSVFVGGVHDFASLVVSVRNRARSIAEIVNKYMSVRAYRLMLAFIWLALVYVLTVFIDLTAATFKADGGVATSSILFIFLAIGFGLALYRLKLPAALATGIFVPLIFLSVWLGQKVPIDSVPVLLGDASKTWAMALVAYCFVASVTPVWALLQPRDYLSSFLLYVSMLGAFAGILFGGSTLKYPAFTGWASPELGPIFPALFVIVACGAVSGFHSVVASGTTSKQIKKETSALPIGYGAMLVEGLVAVIALCTVMMIDPGDPMTRRAPLAVYGAGIAKFFSVFGVPEKYGSSIGILALSTFMLTTLDTATRLARYVLEEFFGAEKKNVRYLATAATLSLPAVLVFISLKDANGTVVPAWKVIWPVFGATNQLLAGLALMVAAVWLRQKGKPIWFAAMPMAFMLAMASWALLMLVRQYGLSLIGIIGFILLILAALLIMEAVTVFRAKPHYSKASHKGAS